MEQCLVEVVRVQRGAGAVRRDHDLGHGHMATGLLAAQQDVGAKVQRGWHRFTPSQSLGLKTTSSITGPDDWGLRRGRKSSIRSPEWHIKMTRGKRGM